MKYLLDTSALLSRARREPEAPRIQELCHRDAHMRSIPRSEVEQLDLAAGGGLRAMSVSA